MAGSKEFSFISFYLSVQLSHTNGKLTSLEVAIPFLECCDDLKALLCVELKYHFLRFPLRDLALPVHDIIPRGTLKEFSLNL
jgi:hypothetical protein